MRRAVLAAGLISVAAPAPACETQLMSCTFEGGETEVNVCMTGDDVTYAFGPTGAAPDLALSEPIETIDYLPWPGVGSAIWETITFFNDGYSYEVLAGFHRNPEDPDQFGGITVRQDETVIAELSCDVYSIQWTWETTLFDAKRAKGLCWDFGREAGWKPCQVDP